MYSPEIIDRRIRSVESTYSVRFHRYSIADSLSITDHLSSAFDDRGHQLRALSSRESDFIFNEIVLSRCDFRYWAERYCRLIVDDEEATRKNITLTPAQIIILARMSATEDRMWRERDEGHTRFDGQCYFVHKSGQMGISTHCEIVGVHRLNFYPDTMGLLASQNDQMTQKLYTDYFRSVYESMPPWMRAPLTSKIKDRGLDLATGSRAVLQDASQKSGLGQGSKWHFVHLTECAVWPDPVNSVEANVFPRISRSIKGIAFLESTSAGMHDWWHQRTEMARRRELNRWQYLFIPWYLIPGFYHDYPPDGWSPLPETLQERDLIERTSPEWANGETIHPTAEMMFWWERTRQNYQRMGTLNEFYKAHPSTPEQSFTHSGQSSFEVEVLESLQRQVQAPVAYELATPYTESELVLANPSDPSAPRIYSVGKYDLVPVRVRPQDPDPRGLILIWEPPSDRHDYFGGADPAIGIANWSRHLRARADSKRDNSALQIIRRGYSGLPDTQVAEFAAPIFPQDFALYLNLLGRLYHGRADERQMMWTIEVNMHGILCQQELISRYDYSHLYQRRRSSDGATVSFLDQLGWVTNGQTIRELWAFGKKHISDARLLTRSNWLVTEMRDCTDDDIRLKSYSYGKAEGSKPGGGWRHDDRVYSMLFALEGAHSWMHQGMLDMQPPQPAVTSVAVEGSPRRDSVLDRDMTYLEYQDACAEWDARIGDILM